jgi:hypothetical protein
MGTLTFSIPGISKIASSGVLNMYFRNMSAGPYLLASAVGSRFLQLLS